MPGTDTEMAKRVSELEDRFSMLDESVITLYKILLRSPEEAERIKATLAVP